MNLKRGRETWRILDKEVPREPGRTQEAGRDACLPLPKDVPHPGNTAVGTEAAAARCSAL